MNCESCGQAMTAVYGQDHFCCPNCNRFQFPTSIDAAEDSLTPTSKATEFNCPKCNVSLEVGSLRKMIDVCFCPNCRGYVIDSATLGPLISQLRSSYRGADDRPLPLDPNELDVRQICPACGEAMEAHPYHGPGNSVIETCVHCNLAWFDHGELARIVRSPGLRSPW